jgi:cytochrome c peroxidase
MHDGRFSNLEAVLNHYHNGVKKSNTLSTLLYLPLQNKYGVAMNEEDKENLMAFLKTLTDSTIATNNKFSNPFK